jgi:hypothetical protein
MVFVSQFALVDAQPAETREDPASSPAEWDVVVLKSGGRIEGLIVKEDGKQAVVERPSAAKDRFYTASINKKDVAKIMRMPAKVRTARQERRSERINRELAARQERDAALAEAQEKALASPAPTESRGYVPDETDDAFGAGGGDYGAYGGGMGGMGGYGGMMGGGMRGGMGGMGGGMGGMGGGMGGMRGGMGGMGGGMGNGMFINIMQLFMPVNHALVGEVEPVIGLTGQIGRNQNQGGAAVGGGAAGGRGGFGGGMGGLGGRRR